MISVEVHALLLDSHPMCVFMRVHAMCIHACARHAHAHTHTHTHAHAHAHADPHALAHAHTYIHTQHG